MYCHRRQAPDMKRDPLEITRHFTSGKGATRTGAPIHTASNRSTTPGRAMGQVLFPMTRLSSLLLTET